MTFFFFINMCYFDAFVVVCFEIRVHSYFLMKLYNVTEASMTSYVTVVERTVDLGNINVCMYERMHSYRGPSCKFCTFCVLDCLAGMLTLTLKGNEYVLPKCPMGLLGVYAPEDGTHKSRYNL